MRTHATGYKNIYITSETHQALKLAACKINVSMREFIETAIQEKLATLEKEAQSKKK